jgi:heat shock protein HslJ
MPHISPRLLAAACVASGLITAACASSGPPALSSDLAGTSWQVQSISGRAVAGRAPSVMFAAEDRISGVGGCNRFFGVYEARDGYIDVRALGRTEMACDSPVMRSEETFLDLLGEAAQYRRERDRLVITAEDGRNIVLAPA